MRCSPSPWKGNALPNGSALGSPSDQLFLEDAGIKQHALGLSNAKESPMSNCVQQESHSDIVRTSIESKALDTSDIKEDNVSALSSPGYAGDVKLFSDESSPGKLAAEFDSSTVTKFSRPQNFPATAHSSIKLNDSSSSMSQSKPIVLDSDEEATAPDPPPPKIRLATFGLKAKSSKITRPAQSRPPQTTVKTLPAGPSITTEALLRRRTHGFGNEFSAQRQLRTAVIEDITLQRSWKGASGDIVSAAWHPDSQTYVVGATATSNAEDLQYNRPNNLLYGNTNHNTLHELPDHRIDRPRPDTIANGPNASEAVFEACDPKVYKTVSAIHYSPVGTRLYTASHDRTVKIWDIPLSEGLPSCIKTLKHDARLNQLDVSSRIPNTFATGSQATSNSIHIYTQATLQSPYAYINLGSSRAEAKPRLEIFPECLRWGNTPMTEDLLLVGFARWGDLPDNDPGRDGELCVWDINTAQRIKKTPSSQSVTTATFHPFLNAFATGGAAGNRLTHRYTTRTVVRMWDMRSSGCVMELECPALDMQDLIFHPRNKDIVAVGCTDGAAYLWDARKPEYILHKLQHGQPIADWDQKYGGNPLSREQGDAGVTLTSWGGNHLYTGATDGMVKRWDVNLAPEDALINDIAQLSAGISCGSFSPDSTSLLVGDSTGGVHLLLSGPGYLTEEERKFGKGPIQYTPAPRNQPPPSDNEPGQGQLASLELLNSGQLTMHPVFGVGQGPAYEGPYAAYAHEVGPPSNTRLLRAVEMEQPVSRKDGHVRDNAAARNIRATFARRRYELSQARQRAEQESAEKTVSQSADNGVKPSKKRKRCNSPDNSATTRPRKKIRPVLLVDLTSDVEESGEAVVSKTPAKREMVNDGQGVTENVGDFHDVTRNADVLEEDFEDDHWFPYMDLDVFARLTLDG